MPNPAKILIVDDEPHVRRFLKKLLRVHVGAAEIIEAEDGPSAVALYTTERPDLVLLDIHLIGSSGLDALGEICALDAEATVVMLTAVDVRHAIEDAMEKGARGYLLKDTPLEQLTEDLLEIIAREFGASSSSPESP